ncbi:Acryloyl-CoA reductase (NADH) [compost metagenome]|jgi:alkylation response protein AidB-like acyl-CoA dehydrogenase
MNLNLSDEQEMIRASVFDYFSSAYGFDRHLERLGQPGRCAAAWQAMGELGWLGLTVPQEDGGLGLGAQEAMLLMEGAGAALNTEPLLASAILAAPLLAGSAAGSPAAQALQAAIAGQVSLALAWTESDRGFAPLQIKARAEHDGQAWRLSGRKVLVDNGADADWLVVAARGEAGLALFLVEAGGDGVTRAGAPMADGSRSADIVFDNALATACLASGPATETQLLQAVYRGLAATCAEALGAMERTLEICRDYLHERSQFGKPLAALQVLQHRFVDMLIATERARSMTLLAAIRADEAATGDTEARRDLSLAKLTVGRSARHVGGQAIQLHGGMGMAYEYPVGHYYRKLLCCDTAFGSQDDHLALLGASLAASADD